MSVVDSNLKVADQFNDQFTFTKLLSSNERMISKQLNNILRQVLPYTEEAKLLLTPLLPRLRWNLVPTAFALMRSIRVW
jgi:hypothetical protein